MRTVRIDGVRRGGRATTVLAWGLFLAAAAYVATVPGQGKFQSVPVIAVVAGLLALAIAASVNAWAIARGRGGLSIEPDGLRCFTWWGGARFHPWDAIERFDVLFVDPNDGQSREQVGFFRKSDNAPGRFVPFSGALDLPNRDAVAILEHVRQLPPEARAALSDNLETLRAQARAAA